MNILLRQRCIVKCVISVNSVYRTYCILVNDNAGDKVGGREGRVGGESGGRGGGRGPLLPGY